MSQLDTTAKDTEQFLAASTYQLDKFEYVTESRKLLRLGS